MKATTSNRVPATMPETKDKSQRAWMAAVLLAMLASAHGGQIFVSNDNGFAGLGSLGEYSLDGSSVNASLIPEGGLNLPGAIAISGTNLFIANWGSGGYVGEYTTSGATVNASLITGLNNPAAIVVSGTNLFIADAGSGTIGQYTTSGATVNAALITGLNGPYGLALSGGSLFVANAGNGTIGQYSTSGATVNAALISGLSAPQTLAISGGNLFVNNGGATISEYNLNGTLVNSNLLTGLSPGVQAIAVDGTNLFLELRGGSYGEGRIAEYTTSGVPVNAGLITGLYEPTGLAITPPVPTLSIATVGGQSVLFWPVSFTNYVLQSTTNLASPNWVTASDAVPVIAVTVTNTSPARFFRLQQQP